MSENYFPHIVQKWDTLLKIVYDSKKNIKKIWLIDDLHLWEIITYENNQLKINNESAYKNAKLITRYKLKKLALNFDVFDIKDWDWISKVIWRKNSIKFKSVLSRFPTQFAWDKVEIKWDTISLIRNWSILKSLSLGWETKMKLSINTESDNNIENKYFNDRIKLLRLDIKKDYNNLKYKSNFSLIKKSQQYKNIPTLLKWDWIFWEWWLSKENKLPIPNNEWKVISRWTFERNDWKITLPKKHNPYSFLTLQRPKQKNWKRWATIVWYYWEDGTLKYWAYTSIWKGTNSKNKTPQSIHWMTIEPMFGSKVNKSKFTHINHISNNEGKSFMMYSVWIKNGYRFHFYKTTGFNISWWCTRLPLAYAKLFYEEVRNLENKWITPQYYTNKLY